MIDVSSYRRDTALKLAVIDAHDRAQSSDGDDAWRQHIGEVPVGEVTVVANEGDTDGYALTTLRLADIVGRAIAAVRRADGNQEVFDGASLDLLNSVVAAVRDRLTNRSQILESDLFVTIEGVLIERKQYEVVKAMVLGRAYLGAERGLGSVKVIRRNGQIVPWNANKIEVAIRKAFLAQKLDSTEAVNVTQQVTDRVLARRQAFVHIEEVQDLVQEELMKSGAFKVAEAYILYRAQRQVTRATEVGVEEQPIGDVIQVVEADGRSIEWDGSELAARVDFALLGLESLSFDRETIITELRRALNTGIDRESLKKTILLNAKAMMEWDAGMNKFAGRILLTYIYEEVLDWSIVEDGIGTLKGFHRRYFREYLNNGVRIKRLSPKLAEYDVDRLAAAIDPSSDWEFDYLGIQTLYDRYLIVDKTGKKPRRIETPQIFWMRVSMGLFLLEENDAEERVLELYDLYRSRRFCSSTPTLFNAGTLHSQLSSCYLYWIDDSLHAIMQRGIAENAYLSKWAGGLGGSWTAVRGIGAYIAGTNGESQGVIPFLKLHNDQLVAVNQGGKRRGSGCAYLETWHNDLYDFLELRRNTGDERRRCHDMNTANWIPDLFMKRMESRQDWTFFRSNEVPDLHDTYGREFEEKYTAYEAAAERGEIWAQTMPAIEVWKQMLRMLFETGHPWITFKDPCNIRSPQDHAGVIHSSNLCTEITLNTGPDETAVCNLGSVVIENHLDADGNIDQEKLRDTVRVAVRALDNVIDLNLYPTDPAKTANSRHRPVGLGVMGLHNALYKKNIAFASSAAVDFSDEMMEAIAYYAYDASSDLAQERGTYSSYEGSKWSRGLLPPDTVDLLEQERGIDLPIPRGGKLDWGVLREKILAQGMRNSNVLAIAPTATIANITGTSPCIEPTYKNLYVKSNLSGDFLVLNQFMVEDLKEEGLWNKEMRESLKYFDGDLGPIEAIPQHLKDKYSTAFDIPYQFLIDAGARRQKWIDQSQSLNLFLAEPDLKTLSHMYRYAWGQGLKTTYYLRTLGASNIEKATVGKRPEADAPTQPTQPKVCSILDPDCEACQ